MSARNGRRRGEICICCLLIIVVLIVMVVGLCMCAGVASAAFSNATSNKASGITTAVHQPATAMSLAPEQSRSIAPIQHAQQKFDWEAMNSISTTVMAIVVVAGVLRKWFRRAPKVST